MGKWYAASASGAVTYVGAGTGLTGGAITTTGTLSVDVGVTANKILQLNTSAQLPAVDGALLTNLNASRLGTRAVSSTLPSTGQILTWNAAGAQWDAEANAGLTALNGDVGAVGPGTLYTLMRVGAVVYVSWSSGF